MDHPGQVFAIGSDHRNQKRQASKYERQRYCQNCDHDASHLVPSPRCPPVVCFAGLVVIVTYVYDRFPAHAENSKPRVSALLWTEAARVS